MWPGSETGGSETARADGIDGETGCDLGGGKAKADDAKAKADDVKFAVATQRAVILKQVQDDDGALQFQRVDRIDMHFTADHEFARSDHAKPLSFVKRPRPDVVLPNTE